MGAPQQHHDEADAAPGGLLARLRRAAEWISGAMFVAVFLIFNYKIITRYLEHDEAVWADEVSVILFVWIIFWASAFLVRDREQITFDLAYRPLPEQWKRIFSIARHLLIGGVFIWSLHGSIDYILFLWRERTPVLNLRLDYIYSCFGLFLVAVAVRSVVSLVTLLGPRWRSQI
ncbi:TRAP transporter small permease [Terrarubrum flagellatum]|uniref:TRAP transporter small permease n=1 Tax=Terrirubrum flagellatum TaxID=2895980 RepID=UPI003144F392